MTERRSRRTVLRSLGAAAAAGLAGCTGGSGGDEDASDGSGGTATATATPTGTATATATGTPTASEAVEVTDMVGRTVTVEGSVDRIVGLGSGALRMLTYVGATDRVVGVEQLETRNEKRPYRPYVHANPGLSELPSVGSRKSPDLERLLSVEPDVVVYGYLTEGKANDLQSKLGVPVVVVRPGDMNEALRPDFFRTLELLGTVLGGDARDRAETLTAATRDAIADVRERAPGVEDPPTAYVGFVGRGNHGLTRTQPGYPPFEWTGAENVVQGLPTSKLKQKKGAARADVDPEQVVEWDPENLFVDLGTESYDSLSNPEFASIDAIETGDVYGVLPVRDYSINFATGLANAYYVGSVCFPDAYADVDPAARADELYGTFVGEPVYEAVTESYGDGFGKMEV